MQWSTAPGDLDRKSRDDDDVDDDVSSEYNDVVDYDLPPAAAAGDQCRREGSFHRRQMALAVPPQPSDIAGHLGKYIRPVFRSLPEPTR